MTPLGRWRLATAARRAAAALRGAGDVRPLSAAAGAGDTAAPAVELTDRRVIRVVGDAPAQFLQGLATNDMRLLEPGGLLYSGFLNTQGRLLFDAFLLLARGGSASPSAPAVLLCDVDTAVAPQATAHLLRHRLRARVAVEDASAEWAVCVRPAAETSDAATSPHPTSPLSQLQWNDDPRLPGRLWSRALVPRAAAAGAEPAGAAGAAAANALAGYRRHRMHLGVAEGSAELAGELPLEAGLDGLAAVSFAKGCYLGQELTARTRFRGVVRKRVLPVFAAGALPLPPVGALLGLALLRLADVRDGIELRAEDGSGAASLAATPEWWPAAWRQSAAEQQAGTGDGSAPTT